MADQEAPLNQHGELPPCCFPGCLRVVAVEPGCASPRTLSTAWANRVRRVYGDLDHLVGLPICGPCHASSIRIEAPPRPPGRPPKVRRAPPPTPPPPPPPPPFTARVSAATKHFVPRKSFAELTSANAVRRRTRLIGTAIEQTLAANKAFAADLEADVELEAIVLRSRVRGERTTLVVNGLGRDDPEKLAGMAAAADGGGIARASLRKLAHLDATFPRSYRVREQIVRGRGARAAGLGLSCQ